MSPAVTEWGRRTAAAALGVEVRAGQADGGAGWSPQPTRATSSARTERNRVARDPAGFPEHSCSLPSSRFKLDPLLTEHVREIQVNACGGRGSRGPPCGCSFLGALTPPVSRSPVQKAHPLPPHPTHSPAGEGEVMFAE